MKVKCIRQYTAVYVGGLTVDKIYQVLDVGYSLGGTPVYYYYLMKNIQTGYHNLILLQFKNKDIIN